MHMYCLTVHTNTCVYVLKLHDYLAATRHGHKLLQLTQHDSIWQLTQQVTWLILADASC